MTQQSVKWQTFHRSVFFWFVGDSTQSTHACASLLLVTSPPFSFKWIKGNAAWTCVPFPRKRAQLQTEQLLNVWNSQSGLCLPMCDVQKRLREDRNANLASRISYLLPRENQIRPDDLTVRLSVCAQRKRTTPPTTTKKRKKKLKFPVWGSVSRCGRRQVVFSSEYVDGKEGGRKGGRYGWSVDASHWCALSCVGINHDSEMTYFLTPQTNCTFNRSRGLGQTTFFPCSLSKLASSRIELPRHNAGGVRFYLRHRLLQREVLGEIKINK